MRLLIAFLVILFLVNSDRPSLAQQTSPAKAFEHILAGQQAPFLKGYQNRIAGEIIMYHSANEYVQSALLSRATDGKYSVEWSTEPVPAKPVGSHQTFMWLAGLAGSKGVYKFDMSVNGLRFFTFSTSRDSTEKTWVLQRRDGSSLTFVATKVDQFGDLFGYMFLRMPTSVLKLGEALTIKVTGEAGASSAWYMTFQHALEPTVRIQALPLLAKRKGVVTQLIKVGIEHYGTPKTISVYTNATNRIKRTITWGLSSFMFPVKAVTQPVQKEVVVESPGQVQERKAVMLKPVQKRVFYLLPHSHTDIGYSAYQREVEKSHIRYVDEALELAAKTSSYPQGSRFKWNIEVLWPLESYWIQATEIQKTRMVDAIRNGQIGLNGLYANILTGLSRPEELVHATDFARRFGELHGIKVTSAMITDIPAYTSTTVTGLGLGGIKYFSSGPNYMPNLFDGGDRVGYALKEWGDKPFYWQSQSRQHKVLFWMAGRGYSWFHGLNMGNLGGASITTICNYLDELDKKHYPYNIVQVRYTVGGDNGPPDPDLSDQARAWNEQYASPKMVIATTQEMFEEFERRYGRNLPTYQGDLTPYWEDGAVSTAREVAMNRRTAERLLQAEALSAMVDRSDYDNDQFYSAWRKVVLFSEHTWGAANSISEPDSPNVTAQWVYKMAFADDANKEADDLLRKHLGRLGPTIDSTALDIVNTNSWIRSDLVVIPQAFSTTVSSIKDDAGNAIPFQKLSTGGLAVVVRDIPPFGRRRIVLGKGVAPAGTGLPIGMADELAAGSIHVSMDAKSGAIRSITWNDKQLVDISRGSGLNQYFYVPGKDPKLALTDTAVTIKMRDAGPVFDSYVVESSPPGCNSFQREIRIIRDLERIDIVDTFDKKTVRAKEAVHLAFPFLAPSGVVRTDGGWEVIRPETDQLAGACRDFFSVQRWVDVSNESYGITMATVDAPLIEMGDMTDETLSEFGTRNWRRSLKSTQTLYSYVMNNYWHTNYKADQGGTVVLRYALRPHNRFELSDAVRFGIEQSQPLLVVPANSTKPPQGSLFVVEPSAVIVSSVKPTKDRRGWIVRLFNASSNPAQASLRWNESQTVRYYGSDAFEDKNEEIRFPIMLPQYGTSTIRIE